MTAGTVPLIIFARNKPPTPPSKAAADRKEEKIDFKKEVGLLLKNKSYLLLCISYMSIDSVVTAMGAIVALITEPYGYSPAVNSICGALFIVFGIIGAFSFSVYLDRKPQFKMVMMITSLIAALALVGSIFTLPWKQYAFAFNLAIIGFSSLPMTPLSLHFAVELTYPAPEAISNGMMILPNKVWGAFMGVIASILC